MFRCHTGQRLVLNNGRPEPHNPGRIDAIVLDPAVDADGFGTLLTKILVIQTGRISYLHPMHAWRKRAK